MKYFLKGFRTRIFSVAVFVLGALELLSPDMLSTALGLGDRGHAIVFIAISVLIFVLRQLTTTPPGKKL